MPALSHISFSWQMPLMLKKVKAVLLDRTFSKRVKAINVACRVQRKSETFLNKTFRSLSVVEKGNVFYLDINALATYIKESRNFNFEAIDKKKWTTNYSGSLIKALTVDKADVPSLFKIDNVSAAHHSNNGNIPTFSSKQIGMIHVTNINNLKRSDRLHKLEQNKNRSENVVQSERKIQTKIVCCYTT